LQVGSDAGDVLDSLIRGLEPAVKVFMPAGALQPIVVHYEEHCPPDVGAAFIWLKNRDPERWRDVQNVEHVLGKYIISDRPMSEAEWAAERATVIDEKATDVTPALPKGNCK
jgi:hypothetical protein